LPIPFATRAVWLSGRRRRRLVRRTVLDPGALAAPQLGTDAMGAMLRDPLTARARHIIPLE